MLNVDTISSPSQTVWINSNQKKSLISSNLTYSWRLVWQLRKPEKKYENLKNAFSKICHKMSMGKVPTNIFRVREFFYRKFVKNNFRGRGPQKSTILPFFKKYRLFSFHMFSREITTKISKTLFRKYAIKCRWGGYRLKFFVCLSFFIESLSKIIFEVGDPKNRRFWAFFQKSMSEISVRGEKTCSLCCRFFRKIEEMGC